METKSDDLNLSFLKLPIDEEDYNHGVTSFFLPNNEMEEPVLTLDSLMTLGAGSGDNQHHNPTYHILSNSATDEALLNDITMQLLATDHHQQDSYSQQYSQEMLYPFKQEFEYTPNDDKNFQLQTMLHALSTARDQDVPQTAESALVINQTMQEALTTYLQQVDAELQHVQDMKSFLQNQSSAYLQDSLKKDEEAPLDNRIYSSSPYEDETIARGPTVPKRFIRNPYFMTYNGDKCYPNEDEIRRTERQELSFCSLKPGRYLDDKEGLVLMNAVAECVKDEQIRPLLGKRKGLTEKMVRYKKKKLTLAVQELSQEIAALDKSINDCKKRSVKSILKSVSEEEGITKIPFDKVSMLGFNGSLDARSCFLAYKNMFHSQVNREAWTKDEDRKLMKLVQELGENEWPTVAEMLATGRTAFICCQRWQLTLNPSMKRSRQWTSHEYSQLVRAVKEVTDEHSVNWRSVASFLNSRTSTECRSHMSTIGLGMRPWTSSELCVLLSSVDRFGMIFSNVSPFVGSRTTPACREQYTTLATVDEAPWSYAEDRALYLLVDNKLQQLKERGKTFDISRIIMYNDPIQWNEFLPFFAHRTIASLYLRLRSFQLSKQQWSTLRDTAASGNDLRLQDAKNLPFLRKNRVKFRDQSIWDPADARRVLLKTPLLTKLMKTVRDSNRKKEISNSAEEVITSHCQNKVSDLVKMILNDAEQGIVIPRPLTDGNLYKGRSIFERLIRETFHKNAIKSKIQQCVENYVLHTKNKISVQMRTHCENLCNNDDDSHFWIVLEDLIARDKDLSGDFAKCRTVRDCVDLIPVVVKKMIHLDDKRSAFLQKLGSQRRKRQDVKFNAAEATVSKPKTNMDAEVPRIPKDKQALVMQINELLNKKHKTLGTDRKQDFVSLSRSLYEQITKPSLSLARPVCDRRVYDFLSYYLRFSPEDRIDLLNTPIDQYDDILKESIPPLPLNKSAVIGFKTLLMHRENLLKSGGDLFSKITELKKNDYKLSESMTEDKETYEMLLKVLNQPEFHLLKARFFSIFAWPALLATMDFKECLLRKDDCLNEVERLESERLLEESNAAAKRAKKKHAIEAEKVVVEKKRTSGSSDVSSDHSGVVGFRKTRKRQRKSSSLDSGESNEGVIGFTKKKKVKLGGDHTQESTSAAANDSSSSDSSSSVISSDSSSREINFSSKVRRAPGRKRRGSPTVPSADNPTKVLLQSSHHDSSDFTLPYFHYEGNLRSNMNECPPETFLAPKPIKLVRQTVSYAKLNDICISLKDEESSENSDVDAESKDKEVMSRYVVDSNKQVIRAPKEFRKYLQSGYRCKSIAVPSDPNKQLFL